MRSATRLSILTAGAAAASAQMLMGTGAGAPRINNTDVAIFEAGEKRNDLPCTVDPDKAFLGFDMRFHAGFDVTVPLKELAGGENLLTVIFRVTPAKNQDGVKYFIQRFKVPQIDEDAKGETLLQGGFDLGEGKYKVEWLMRDRAERVCAHFWDVEAELPSKDRQMALVIPPDTADQGKPDQFQPEAPVQRTGSETPLHVKIIMNFAPQKPTAPALKPIDLAALVSMLRALSRDPRIGSFTLVGFNMTDQKVFHRQEKVDRIDFPEIGKALGNVAVGTVSLKALSVKNSTTQFLSQLIQDEVNPKTKADAVIFAGPKALLDQNVPDDELKKMLPELEYPVFYMNYILNPQATPWRDAIGNAVKTLKGTEYTVTRPRDLWYSVSEMVGRIVKFRNGKSVTAVSTDRGSAQ